MFIEIAGEVFNTNLIEFIGKVNVCSAECSFFTIHMTSGAHHRIETVSSKEIQQIRYHLVADCREA